MSYGYVPYADRDAEIIRATLDLWRYGASSTRGAPQQYSRSEIVSDSRTLFSYGRHFPLVHFTPSKLRGRGPDGKRRPDLFVLNGDEWRGGGWHPSRTPGHQETVRSHVALYDADSLILPLSAIEGAGIELDSIRPVHVRDDARWTETRERRTLAELPRHERKVSYSVEREENELERVPLRYRSTWRAMTDSERAERERERGRELAPYELSATLPLLPGPDGRFHWTETRFRDRAPDPESGLYTWTETLHRLGDSLFSAVRPLTSTRRAAPFECESETARYSVELSAHENGRSRHCDRTDSYRHEAGPSGACVHCGAELHAVETWRRRALYLSSFDLNESPPLYFLAEVPPSSGADTVETALDALAPRAVHAAIARERHVARQGDVFFIDTDLSTEELAERGARFGRLTQFTRSAAARTGEVGATPKLTAAQRRRRARLERADARRAWIHTMRVELARDSFNEWRERDRAAKRHATAERFSELHERRAELGELFASELSQLRYEHGRGSSRGGTYSARPETGHGNRKRARIARERARAELDSARAELRAAILKGPRRERYPYGGAIEHGRRAHVAHVTRARERVTSAAARLRTCELARGLGERDHYRSHGRRRACETWTAALESAQRRYRPETVFDTARFRAYRELTRRHLAVYGTAHSATLVARVGSAVYVSGTVRHIPELELNRFGGADHAPLTLTAGRWYLAVRNTVPRQARRRRRRKSVAV